MRIKKTYRSAVQAGKVLNETSTSTDNTYSCDYLNGTTLYENASGSNGETITLSDSASNYSYLEIFFRNADNAYNSTKIYSPNSKSADLTSHYYYNGTLYAKSSCYLISDKSLVRNAYGAWYVSGSGSGATISADIYIVKVVGYK